MTTPQMLYAVGVGDPYGSDVVLLQHYNGADASTTITDETGNVMTAHGAAALDTAQSVFGGASLFIPNASADYIDTPYAAEFDIGAQDFTIEFRIRLQTNVTGTRSVLLHTSDAFATAANSAIYIYYAAGILKVQLSQGGGSTVYSFGSAISHSTWYAIAITRQGTTLTAYQDGVSLGNNTIAGSDINAPATGVRIGGYATGSNGLNGWLDEFRWTMAKRYSANYTPSAIPFVYP